MHLRPAATVFAVVLVATACSGAADTELADGPTVEEVRPSVEADDGTEVSTGDEAAPAQDAEATPARDGEATVGPSPDGAAGVATADTLSWTAQTVADDRPFEAADLAGRNVVLWMWAPWCSVCNREAPEVADALADLPADVTLVGVAGRDDVGPMRDFVAEHGLEDMVHVVDADGSIWSSYGVSYQPAWVFIGADGNASVAAGALGRDGLFEGIEQVFRS